LVADNTQARTSPEGKQFSVHPVREEGVLRDCKKDGTDQICNS